MNAEEKRSVCRPDDDSAGSAGLFHHEASHRGWLRGQHPSLPCARGERQTRSRYGFNQVASERIRNLREYTNGLYMRAVRRPTRTAAEALFAVAEGQQGCFTAKQAADAGYQLGSQAHHVKSGNWVRVERGIYRLVRFPQSDEEQLVTYALWSRNRAGVPEGVYSHQTALSIHALSDVNPAKLHLTVPVAFRRRAKMPKVLVLHRAGLDEKDIEERHGFKVTRALRSIADLAAAETVSRDIIAQALTQGRQRGLISAREITELRRRGQLVVWFDELLMEKQR